MFAHMISWYMQTHTEQALATPVANDVSVCGNQPPHDVLWRTPAWNYRHSIHMCIVCACLYMYVQCTYMYTVQQCHNFRITKNRGQAILLYMTLSIRNRNAISCREFGGGFVEVQLLDFQQ